MFNKIVEQKKTSMFFDLAEIVMSKLSGMFDTHPRNKQKLILDAPVKVLVTEVFLYGVGAPLARDELYAKAGGRAREHV